MTFKTAWFCVNCKGEISNDQMMYSYGRCPLCGFKHENACTVVKTFERTYRIKKNKNLKWWKPSTYYIREFLELSKEGE